MHDRLTTIHNDPFTVGFALKAGFRAASVAGCAGADCIGSVSAWCMADERVVAGRAGAFLLAFLAGVLVVIKEFGKGDGRQYNAQQRWIPAC